jgi:single-strand DNA-binding protein
MSSLNRVQLIGRLGKDPETRRLQSGDPVTNLSIATSETWRDKASGERKEKTEWHKVVCFNKELCDVMDKYLRKGSQVFIEGALQTRKWTDKDGVERYSTEIVIQAFNGKLVMLGDNQSGTRDSRDTGRREEPQSFDHSDLDDEIPF